MLQLLQLIESLHRAQINRGLTRWWAITLVQAIAAIVAMPLAIILFSRLP